MWQLAVSLLLGRICNPTVINIRTQVSLYALQGALAKAELFNYQFPDSRPDEYAEGVAQRIKPIAGAAGGEIGLG